MTLPRLSSLARVVALAALILAPRVVAAQGRPISLWLGAGRAFGSDSIAFSLRNLEASAAVQLELPVFPVALRAEVDVAGGDVPDGRRNLIVSAVMPVRLPVVQPYGMIGYGRYDWGKSAEDDGFSAGAGVRLQLGGTGLFGQLRRHFPLDRNVLTLGVVF